MSNNFPWIGESKAGYTFLFYGEGLAYNFAGKMLEQNTEALEAVCKNVTAEFLIGKRARFYDDTHRDFMIELAESNGLIGKVASGPSIEFVCKEQFRSGILNMVSIVDLNLPLPLPPKAEPEQEPEQWTPKVGDLVNCTPFGEVMELVTCEPDVAGFFCVMRPSGSLALIGADDFTKASESDIATSVIGSINMEKLSKAGFKVVRK